MKFAIQVNASPYQSNAGYTAYQFIKAALAAGHEVFRVFFVLVPKLQLGNSVWEALASRLAKLELRYLGSQAGAWELAYFLT